MSTGLLSKRSRPRLSEITNFNTPDTPCKRPPVNFGQADVEIYHDRDVPPTPTRSSPLSKKLRSAADESDSSSDNIHAGNTSNGSITMEDCVTPSMETEMFPSLGSPITPTCGTRINAAVTPPSPPSSSPTLDEFESQYEILDTLGKGEFSQAFKVQDRSSGQISAVKRTKYPFTGVRDRLRRLEEVEILRHIGKHPNCLSLEHAWEEKGHLYIRTELCENGTLAVFLDEVVHRMGSLEADQVWKIFAEVCLGVQHIHGADVIHLDLKPANIFIGNDGRLKIGDFGLAARLPIKAGMEREGDREYIAPEILFNGNYSRACDIFSLGLILLEMASGIMLPDNGAEWQKLRVGDLSDVPMDKGTTLDESPEMRELILWMLQPAPENRPTIDQVVVQVPKVQAAVQEIKRGEHALKRVVSKAAAA